jgi:hypothetical protein
LIGFCDADGQFEIASFGTLLAALVDHEADLAFGYRIARADSLKRRLMGRAWAPRQLATLTVVSRSSPGPPSKTSSRSLTAATPRYHRRSSPGPYRLATRWPRPALRIRRVAMDVRPALTSRSSFSPSPACSVSA